MTATEVYSEIAADLDKSITAILNVRTTLQIGEERKSPGYKYNPDKHLTEYAIAISQITFGAYLSQLSPVLNAGDSIVPNALLTRADLVNFQNSFANNKTKAIAAINRVIDKPNLVFIGYEEPITMEKYLEIVIRNIRDEANCIANNYKLFLSAN